MQIINCTPHPINIQNDNIKKTIQPSGKIIRVDTTPSMKMTTIMGIPVSEPDLLGEVYLIKDNIKSTLPEEKAGVFYLVSAIVGSQLKGTRTDILIGASAPKDKPIRHPEKGFILAVRRLKHC